MTPPELVAELLRLSARLDQGSLAVRDRGRALAEAERDYRKARAAAWLTVEEGVAAQRKDQVDGDTADLRYLRDLAGNDRQSALEAVRNGRTQISALQTIGGVERELAAFSRTSPELAP